MLKLRTRNNHNEQGIPPTHERLRILREEEIAALYGRPRFTPEERGLYFSLSPPEQQLLQTLRSVKSQAYCVLQLGYFKARHLFFTFALLEVTEDLHYVLAQHFKNQQLSDWSPVDKHTRRKQPRLILNLFAYQSCDGRARRQLAAKAQQAAMVCGKPVYIFRELLQYLAEQRIVAPGYSSLQDTVGKALTCEQQRLKTLVRQRLQPTERAALRRLLEGPPGLYAITQIKREPRDFSAREIKREIQRGEQLPELYHLANRLLPTLQISHESIKYYASLVTYYAVFRLKRFEEEVVHLYLLCFVYHRYQRVHDHLLNSLIHHVRRYTEEAKEAAKERVYTSHLESNHNLQKAGHVLKLFTDDRIAATTPFHEVQTTAFGILDRSKLESVADQMATHVRFDETAFHWDHVDALALQFKRQLRPILLAVNFAASTGHAPLLAAVQFLQAAFRQGRVLSHASPATFPLRFLPDSFTRYLYAHEAQGQQRLLPDRYEFLVYRLLRNGLEAGDIFCRDSVRFRSFEEDLLDDQRWQQKDQLLIDTGLTLLQQPIQEHLAMLEQQLEARLAEVNQRITSGENAYFQITKHRPQVRWTLQYPHGRDPVNHPFFDTLRQVDIGSVLHFVNRHCHFMEAFVHVLGRYVKQAADDRVITACLVAWGTNMGPGKMGDISDLNSHTLSTTSENFLRLETLQEANDRISNAIAKLPIFCQYDIGDTLHSSSDGQKFETRLPTINARYSPKYFGLHKGVVAYTLVANHVPINAQIIGANEHESHYVFDLLMNNTTDIQPEVHSTDTHGTNEVNFALLHVFGYQFAPRYRDLYDKVRTSLYGFKHPRQYPEGVLKPIRKINTRLIVKEWENLQRIMVSLALKTTTQSIIVGKLSAYARKNQTRRALWEYDNILRSLYLLDYIDSPSLRQHVQQALNRGENYHQLRRAVAYANFGKLRFRTEHDQQLWEECSRLLTNCIIYYNATILSNLLTYKERHNDAEGAALLKYVSPVAWQHINWYGRYEFSKQPDLINMTALIQELAQVPLAPEPSVAV
jgi:TnpA family transposase